MLFFVEEVILVFFILNSNHNDSVTINCNDTAPNTEVNNLSSFQPSISLSRLFECLASSLSSVSWCHLHGEAVMTADRLSQTIFIDKKPGSSVRYSVDLSDFFAISNKYNFKESKNRLRRKTNGRRSGNILVWPFMPMPETWVRCQLRDVAPCIFPSDGQEQHRYK